MKLDFFRSEVSELRISNKKTKVPRVSRHTTSWFGFLHKGSARGWKGKRGIGAEGGKKKIDELPFVDTKCLKEDQILMNLIHLPMNFLLINKIQTASLDLSFSCLWSFLAIFWRLGICAWCGAHVLPKFWCHWSEPKGRLNSTMEFVSMRCTPISIVCIQTRTSSLWRKPWVTPEIAVQLFSCNWCRSCTWPGVPWLAPPLLQSACWPRGGSSAQELIHIGFGPHISPRCETTGLEPSLGKQLQMAATLRLEQVPDSLLSLLGGPLGYGA